jgi:hypothetical protein
MSGLVKPGDGVIFMKVGTHAHEDLRSIIERKRREIDEAGFSMWGYGGNTCHPRTMVQPFARHHALQGKRIVLVMEPMSSHHFAEPVRATDYSIDGITWDPIPAPINVRGSRFALCLSNLDEVDTTIALGDTRVAVGNSSGRVGSDYVTGRVDKACLDVVSDTGEGPRPIGLVAEVTDPYAVLLR